MTGVIQSKIKLHVIFFSQPTFISPWIDGKKAVMGTGKMTREDAVSVEQHEREWNAVFVCQFLVYSEKSIQFVVVDVSVLKRTSVYYIVKRQSWEPEK